MKHIKHQGKHKSAFTLIEIVVVLIILGILAAIALPNLFSYIDKSYAAEAFVGIKHMKEKALACIQLHPDNPYDSCNNTEENYENSDHFTIHLAIDSNNLDFSVLAYGLGNGSRFDVGDLVLMNFYMNGDLLLCVGNGRLKGVC